ncbi:MAG: type II secretion system protein [Parcubacteria group bacterium]|nr:type II secretion system protein [Parcubacteria group bacterium]
MKNNKKGFTLIELLVVIAIIAILSTVVMAGLNSARAKGRDAKRLSDIKQAQAAFEMYYDSCAGYPNAFTTAANTGCTGTTNLGSFLATIPLNPTPGGTTYAYAPVTAATRASYTLTFTLEGTSGSLDSGLHTASPSGISP